ncbi:DegT/DnrJ/EryC1/StrS aminotransferase [Candidatus Koribacter versatilis Ellin345]|uniref:DegT/DnrJ/EryC1/StrS aminotransferase n=1 Tax=Koribacter versatilis (strain Ellin345) TaxID=204669 RepID=Q1ISR6_KORVE|nr:DegT/DnrJ/EryC1/StrS family aminotransferase [Candidatus Koribacter versatilis]ABF40084.1 DegT/DnrJ/EryC1/StrS aminotransferase [Candidatus Koribacter versatilis Ellin345]
MPNADVKVPFVDLKAQYAAIKHEVGDAVSDVLQSCHFVGGPALENFETRFAEYLGAKHCVGVGNGTDAITLALRAAGIGRGDEVLVPANTFFATAEAVTNAGATPVFVDVDASTFHMDAPYAESAITSRTASILPVHLYGQAMDLRPILAIAQRHNLLVIEDCAQAHGAQMHGKTVGSSGRLTCFSFYPGKNLGAYGDGGAITTSDPALHQRLRLLRDHGSPVKYQHHEIGFNSRLDALQAAVLTVKLPYLDIWNAARHANATKLVELIRELPLVVPEIPGRLRHVFHLFVVRCTQRDKLVAFLTQHGIQAGIHYPVPLHLTPAYQALGAPGRGALPVAEQLASEILSLPMFPELNDDQISYIAEVLHDFVQIYQPEAPVQAFELAPLLS